MQIAVRPADALGALGAVGIATAFGAVAAFGGPPAATAVIATPVLALGAAWVVTSALADTSRIGYWLVLIGVALIAANGLRLGPLTYADAFLIAGGGLALLTGASRIPGWLLVGGGLIALSAVIVELVPPLTAPPASAFSSRALGASQFGSYAELQGQNLRFAAQLVYALAVAPALIAFVATSWERVQAIGTAWVAGVGLSALVAVLAAYTSLDLQATLTGETYSLVGLFAGEAGRYTGLTVHPNHLALTVVLATPVVLVRLSTRPVIYAPVLGLFAVAVLISGSRTGIVALVVAGAAVFWLQPASRKPLLWVAAGSAVVGYRFLSSGGFSAVDRLLGKGGSVATSDAARGQKLGEGLELFYDRPLGWGFELVRGAHMAPLQMLTSGGLLALAGYLTVLGGAATLGWRLLQRELPADISALLVAALASLGTWAAASVISNNTLDRWLYMPVALILSTMVAYRCQQQQH